MKTRKSRVVLGPRAVAAVKRTPPGGGAVLGGPPAKGKMDAKGITGLADAMSALQGSPMAPGPVPPPPGPPGASAGPVAPPPMPPPPGAPDGLGAGAGGLAVHPSLKGFAIHGREPRHTSKTR
jgi:hypothetical protein